nr:MAG TPA: hypothetical protein [Caudoviricetes sp.]
MYGVSNLLICIFDLQSNLLTKVKSFFTGF